jgi:acyl dehydratase
VAKSPASSEATSALEEDERVSRWFLVDQKLIDAFADLTQDRQFIHVDPARAATTRFKGTVAHGFLTMALLTAMADDAMPENGSATPRLNYGFDRLRFLAPVPAGSRVRGRFRLAGAATRPGGGTLQRVSVTVEIEDAAKPALAAEWLTLQTAEASERQS